MLMARPPCLLPTDLHHPADGDLHVIVLDVAQGDATLVRFPDDSTMLVDAGGSSGRFDVGARVVSPALWALGRRGLGVLLVTHPDMDHIGGGPAVVEDFRPMAVWEGVPVMQHPLLTRLKRRADAISAGWRRRHAGERFERGRAEMRVRHPPIPSWQRRRARNDDSMVIDLQLGDVQVVLPGDIGAGIEQHVAASLKPARLLVLKAPHHGSRQSSSARFVRALAPDVVIFSAGRDNRYGHPSPDVVARYASAGARIYRTDLDGAVHISTDGKVRDRQSSGEDPAD
jgi:competence protein ComEC